MTAETEKHSCTVILAKPKSNAPTLNIFSGLFDNLIWQVFCSKQFILFFLLSFISEEIIYSVCCWLLARRIDHGGQMNRFQCAQTRRWEGKFLSKNGEESKRQKKKTLGKKVSLLSAQRTRF